jgi:flavin-dependent dehydrogenase
MLYPYTRPDFVQEILGGMDKRVIRREYKGLRVYAPSGKMVKEFSMAGTGARLIRRDYFDQELAKQAVNAGAELRLNTRVTGLLKQDGRVIGVTTSSPSMPNVYGKIVVGTDGIHAVQRGTPKWGGLTRAKETFIGGISVELTRVRDIEPDVFEFHAGAFEKLGRVAIYPSDDVSCTTFFLTMAEFQNIKAGNYAISRKLRDAVPVRMTGWSHASDLGVGLPKVVDDGLILAGSAANIMGTLPALVTGRYAAEVAVEAVREDDLTAKRLSKYEGLCKPLKRMIGFTEGNPFRQLSDEVIETRLAEMIERDEFLFAKPKIL